MPLKLGMLDSVALISVCPEFLQMSYFLDKKLMKELTVQVLGNLWVVGRGESFLEIANGVVADSIIVVDPCVVVKPNAPNGVFAMMKEFRISIPFFNPFLSRLFFPRYFLPK